MPDSCELRSQRMLRAKEKAMPGPRLWVLRIDEL